MRNRQFPAGDAQAWTEFDEEGGTMEDKTELRMKEIRKRTLLYRCRQDRRMVYMWSCFSLLLMAGVGELLRQTGMIGDVAVVGAYSSVLLRDGASIYVVVGIAAFVMGVAITVLCIRLKKRWNKE